MATQETKIYQPRLYMRLAVYSLACVISLVVVLQLAPALPLALEYVVKAFLCFAILIATHESQELSWGLKIWRSNWIHIVMFIAILMCALLVPAGWQRGAAGSAVVFVYCGLAFIATLRNFRGSNYFHMRGIQLSVRRRKDDP